eukprot:6477245-Prymnesium_polylepis.1
MCIRDSYTCAPVCGDGRRVGAESCDDGAAVGGDGCSANCLVEPGWQCSGGSVRSTDNCTTACGDGVRAGPEVCDDGNQVDFDGCSENCDAIEHGFTCGGGSPTSADSCSPCDATCATCQGAAANECTACAASSPFRSGWQDGAGACAADCTALGRWGLTTSFDSTVSESTCELCSHLCKTCSGPNATACLSCDTASGAPFLHSSQCLAQCPSVGFYALIEQETGSGSCLPCDPSCSECTGPSSTSCSSCHPMFPYFQRVPFQSGACLASCPNGSFANSRE